MASRDTWRRNVGRYTASNGRARFAQRRRRDRRDIIGDIIHACRKRTNTSQLLRKDNICHTRLKSITKQLVELGLLKCTGTSYQSTEKGIEWLDYHRQIKNGTSLVDRQLEELQFPPRGRDGERGYREWGDFRRTVQSK